MAFLKYTANIYPLPPTIGPQRTIGIIGTAQGTWEGDKVLHLPSKPSIMPEHAIIIEAKKISFFVLLDRSNGNTYVNGSPVTRLKVLRHKDLITIGDMNKGNAVNLTFYDVKLQHLTGPAICSVCDRSLNVGDKIFRCPRCGHRDETKIYCKRCFLDSRLKNCGCGYAIQPVVNNVLRTAELKEILPGAKSDRLRFETIEAGSELLKKECRSISEAVHIVSRLKEGDAVVFCPQCQTPYHRDCWVRLRTCVHPQCNCSIEKLIFKIFSLD